MTANDAPAGPWEANFRSSMKRLRALRGWNQTDLARQLRARGLPFHQPTVQRIESGDRAVRLDEAFVIADEFDLSVQAMTTDMTEVSNDSLRFAVEGFRRVSMHMPGALSEPLDDWRRHVDYLSVEVEDLVDSAAPVSRELVWAAAWLNSAYHADFKVSEGVSWFTQIGSGRLEWTRDAPEDEQRQVWQQNLLFRATELIATCHPALSPEALSDLPGQLLWRLYMQDPPVTPADFELESLLEEKVEFIIDFFKGPGDVVDS